MTLRPGILRDCSSAHAMLLRARGERLLTEAASGFSIRGFAERLIKKYVRRLRHEVKLCLLSSSAAVVEHWSAAGHRFDLSSEYDPEWSRQLTKCPCSSSLASDQQHPTEVSEC